MKFVLFYFYVFKNSHKKIFCRRHKGEIYDNIALALWHAFLSTFVCLNILTRKDLKGGKRGNTWLHISCAVIHYQYKVQEVRREYKPLRIQIYKSCILFTDDTGPPPSTVINQNETFAKVLFKPSVVQQAKIAQNGVLGDFIVRYDVNRAQSIGDVQVRGSSLLFDSFSCTQNWGFRCFSKGDGTFRFLGIPFLPKMRLQVENKIF